MKTTLLTLILLLTQLPQSASAGVEQSFSKVFECKSTTEPATTYKLFLRDGQRQDALEAMLVIEDQVSPTDSLFTGSLIKKGNEAVFQADSERVTTTYRINLETMVLTSRYQQARCAQHAVF